MLSKIRNKQRGFTIIEVLIVLAIAGLILLVVFLAVPALQRSARNTQRKNDAAQIGGAIASFISNNGGQLPTALFNADSTHISFSNGTSGNSETAKLGYYASAATAVVQGSAAASNGNIFLTAVPATAPTLTNVETTAASATNITTQSVTIITGWACNGTNTGLSTTASPRSAAIIYATENGNGGSSLQCVEQ